MLEQYQLFLFDGYGRLMERSDLVAEDDDEARTMARARLDEHNDAARFELWEGWRVAGVFHSVIAE
jgi:hypothetical protein